MSNGKGLVSLPTTIEAALQPSTEARIITEPDAPYRIVHVNEGWCRTCGFDAEEVLGQTCKFLHGPGTCAQTLSMLGQGLQLKRGLAVQLLNYTKNGRPFMNTLQVAPLYNQSGKVTHYLGVIQARYLDTPAAQAAGAPNGAALPAQPGAGVHSSGGAGGYGAGGLPMPGVPGGSGVALGGGGQMSRLPVPSGGGYGGGGYGGGEDSGRGSYMGDNGGSSMEMGEDGDLASSRVPPFLTKLTEILTVESPDVVNLNPDTPSFTIGDPQRFAKEVRSPLPPIASPTFVKRSPRLSCTPPPSRLRSPAGGPSL